MKVKNINIVEKHIEKLVLLLCFLGLCYSIWAYAVSNPFTVEIDGKQTSVDQIDEVVLTSAERLTKEIDKPAHTELTNLRPPNYPMQFAERHAASMAPGIDGYKQLAFSAEPRLGLVGPDITGPDGPTYHVPVVPAPSGVVVEAGMGTVDPAGSPAITTATHPQTLALLAPAPYDLQWISLGCLFDAEKLRKSLATAPADPRIRKIPVEWWRSTLAMVDVEMQRQELLPDGNWSDPQAVPAMPDSIKGQFRQATGQVALDIAPRMISSLMQFQLAIMQPEFYPLLNQQWAPPGEGEGAGPIEPDDPFADDARVKTLRKQIEVEIKKLETYQKQLQRYQDLGRPVPALLQRRLQDAQKKLQEIETQLQERIRQLELKRQRHLAVPAPVVPETPAPQTPTPGVTGGLVSGSQIQLWAHDLRVEEGKTYRYRVRVYVINPLYSRRMAAEQAEQYTDRFKIASDFSPWSEPVDTGRMRYSFLKSGRSSTRTVAMEVWRFTNAQWFRAEFEATPGDVIGGPSTQYQSLFDPEALVVAGPVDFNTGRTIVDIDFDYPIQSGNLTRPTVRLLYADGNNQLGFQQLSQDTERMKEVLEILRQRMTALPAEPGRRPRPNIMQPPRYDPHRRPPGGRRLGGPPSDPYGIEEN